MDTKVTCSASALLDTWSAHDWSEGLQLESRQDMDRLIVRTENSTYEITVISARTGEILIRGGQFFPEFSPARLAGSSLGGSFLKLRGIYLGFNLELHFDRRLIITSRVRQISIAE
jgi:hypothetical protein